MVNWGLALVLTDSFRNGTSPMAPLRLKPERTWELPSQVFAATSVRTFAW